MQLPSENISEREVLILIRYTGTDEDEIAISDVAQDAETQIIEFIEQLGGVIVEDDYEPGHHKITVTKIDHDSWWGYYIDDVLYGYNDYYNFSDEEVKNAAVLWAIEAGKIRSPEEADVAFVHHTDWPELEADDEMYDRIADEFSSDLPSSLKELRKWVEDAAAE